MGVVRNPNWRQLARTEQRGLRYRVAPVGLHAIARPRRNQRGRHHDAIMSKQGDLPVKAIAARPGFITERQLAMFGGEAIDHFGHRFRPALDFTDEAGLTRLPPSAIATEIVFLCISIATYVVVE
jgi:hypothetical protein